MPRCLNIPSNGKPVYYTGREKTPLGRGISCKYAQIGTVEQGLDGRMYMVGYAGFNSKRWYVCFW